MLRFRVHKTHLEIFVQVFFISVMLDDLANMEVTL